MIEYKILVAIVFILLCMLFIWYQISFKDKSVNKVKGGDVCLSIFQDPKDNLWYKLIGIWTLKPDNHPFFVVSEAGEELFKNNNIYNNYYNSLREEFFNDIKSILLSPINYITGEDTPGRTIELATKYNINELINIINPPNPPTLQNDIRYFVIPNFDDQDYSYKFDFGYYVRPEIYHYYIKMYKHLMTYAGNCVDFVAYIGQTAHKQFTGTINENEKLTIYDSFAMRVSESSKGEIPSEGPVRQLYDIVNNDIRGWYSNSTTMQVILKYGYEEYADGDIKKCDANAYRPTGMTSTNNNQIWNVADIYPAHKLIMMIFLMIALYSKFNGTSDEYKKMIASYVVYAHLINTFCAVKMNSGWNGNIENKYVYIYSIINGRENQQIQIDMNKLTNLEYSISASQIVNHIKSDADLNNYLQQIISADNYKLAHDIAYQLQTDINVNDDVYFIDNNGYDMYSAKVEKINTHNDGNVTYSISNILAYMELRV